MGQRLIVRNNQAPGDIIVLSAALRDLEIAHPGKYAPEIWVSKGAEEVYWNNPNIARIHPGARRVDGRGATMYRAQYPLIKTCNQQRKHFINGFIEHMNSTLHTKIKLTEFRPHIVMSAVEKATRPFDEPYWVFLSGGKTDYPTKIWAQTYWQHVITATKDRINWVQAGGGSKNHIMHEPKHGIYANMVAKTGCRNFLRLIYHAEGVVCVTTMAMHAAAAFNKPCVVIEGGREPWWWEAYNEETRRLNMAIYDPGWSPPADDDFVPHKYLHTIGKLKCCKQHGCWRKRVVGGGSICRDTVSVDGQMVPKCKMMITPEMVVAAIDEYLDVGLAKRPKSVKDIKVPLTAMVTPDAEPQPVAVAPVKPRPSHAEKPPADPGDMRFCVFGEDVPIVLTGPKVHVVDNGTSRVALLRCMMAVEENWIVWIERGAKLHPDCLQLLAKQLTDPAVVGRAHRTRGGTLYPHPAFFAVHRSLLKEADSFAESFAASAGQFKDVRPAATLTTERRVP